MSEKASNNGYNDAMAGCLLFVCFRFRVDIVYGLPELAVPGHWTHGKPEDVGACCSLETVPHTEKTIMFLRPGAAWRLVIIISVCIQMSHTDTLH